MLKNERSLTCMLAANALFKKNLKPWAVSKTLMITKPKKTILAYVLFVMLFGAFTWWYSTGIIKRESAYKLTLKEGAGFSDAIGYSIHHALVEVEQGINALLKLNLYGLGFVTLFLLFLVRHKVVSPFRSSGILVGIMILTFFTYWLFANFEKPVFVNPYFFVFITISFWTYFILKSISVFQKAQPTSAHSGLSPSLDPVASKNVL